MILECKSSSRQKAFSKWFVSNISYWHLQAVSTFILPSASRDCPLPRWTKIYKIQQKSRKRGLRAGNRDSWSSNADSTQPIPKDQQSQRGDSQVTKKLYQSDKCCKVEAHTENSQVQRREHNSFVQNGKDFMARMMCNLKNER